MASILNYARGLSVLCFYFTTKISYVDLKLLPVISLKDDAYHVQRFHLEMT